MKNHSALLALVASCAVLLGPRASANSEVDPAPASKTEQTIDFERVPSKVYLDPDFELIASASSRARVTFTASGDCTVRGATVHILSAGKCWVTAHQPGDASFNAAPDVDQRIPIDKAGQRIRFPEPPARTYLDADFELDAAATSGLPLGFDATGGCSITDSWVHIFAAGSCSLSAHQVGDSNFTAARIVDQAFAIARADQVIQFEGLPDRINGESFPLSARASSGLPVSFVTSGPCVVVGSIASLLGPGTCTVIARQAGDSNYNGAMEIARSFLVVDTE